MYMNNLTLKIPGNQTLKFKINTPYSNTSINKDTVLSMTDFLGGPSLGQNIKGTGMHFRRSQRIEFKSIILQY